MCDWESVQMYVHICAWVLTVTRRGQWSLGAELQEIFVLHSMGSGV